MNYPESNPIDIDGARLFAPARQEIEACVKLRINQTALGALLVEPCLDVVQRRLVHSDLLVLDATARVNAFQIGRQKERHGFGSQTAGRRTGHELLDLGGL